MSSTPVLDFLRDPAHWCRGAYGKDKDGNPLTLADVDKAEKCCLQGAIKRFYPNPFDRPKGLLLIRAAIPREKTMASFNDNITHKQLIELLEKAQI